MTAQSERAVVGQPPRGWTVTAVVSREVLVIGATARNGPDGSAYDAVTAALTAPEWTCSQMLAAGFVSVSVLVVPAATVTGSVVGVPSAAMRTRSRLVSWVGAVREIPL